MSRPGKTHGFSSCPRTPLSRCLWTRWPCGSGLAIFEVSHPDICDTVRRGIEGIENLVQTTFPRNRHPLLELDGESVQRCLLLWGVPEVG